MQDDNLLDGGAAGVVLSSMQRKRFFNVQFRRRYANSYGLSAMAENDAFRRKTSVFKRIV